MLAASQRALPAVLLALLSTACGGGGGGEATTQPPVQGDSFGGIWWGTLNGGGQIIVFATEDGRLHLFETHRTGHGFGTATSRGSTLSGAFTFVPTPGTTLEDGSYSAACTLTGDISERQSLALEARCRTERNGRFDWTTALAYDELYEIGSDLSRVQGYWDDFGYVATIDANGALFEQLTGAGCVLSGYLAIIDPRWNMYGADFRIDGCSSDYVFLNGTVWDGIGLVEPVDDVDHLLLMMSGALGGEPASWISYYRKL